MCDGAFPDDIEEDLDPRHIRAIRLRLEGHDDKVVAAKLGVKPRSIRRWKNTESFQAAQRHVTKRYLDAWMKELIKGIEDRMNYQLAFLHGLLKIIDDPEASTEDWLAAAGMGLGFINESQAKTERTIYRLYDSDPYGSEVD